MAQDHRGKSFSSSHSDIDTSIRIRTATSCGSKFFLTCSSHPILHALWNVDIYKWKRPWASSQPEPHPVDEGTKVLRKGSSQREGSSYHLAVTNYCHWFWSKTAQASSLYNLVYILSAKWTLFHTPPLFIVSKPSIIFNTN